jgi:hypothetical protein
LANPILKNTAGTRGLSFPMCLSRVNGFNTG